MESAILLCVPEAEKLVHEWRLKGDPSAARGVPAHVTLLYPFLPGSHYVWISRLLGIIVLGGMGSLPGAIIGALLIGVAETLTTTYVGPEWATAVPYVVIFVVLLMRPQGLMGARLREDVAL